MGSLPGSLVLDLGLWAFALEDLGQVPFAVMWNLEEWK